MLQSLVIVRINERRVGRDKHVCWSYEGHANRHNSGIINDPQNLMDLIAFHIYIDIENKFIDRWGVFSGEESKKEGTQGEGTTIGFDEPFVLT